MTLSRELHRGARLVSVAAFLAATVACTTAAPRLMPPPPSEPLRGELGAGPLGVAAGRFAPALEYDGGARGAGEGALRGAGQGAVVGALPGMALTASAGGSALAAVGGLALALAGAVLGTPIGAVAGAIAAEPAAKVEARDAAFKTSVAEVPVQRALREHMVAALRRHTRQQLVKLGAHGPRDGTERTLYDATGLEGVPWVLEVSVERVALEGPWSVNPPLHLVMTVRTRLVRVPDGDALYESRLTWEGWSRRPDEWGVGDTLVRREVDRACADLAEKIVDEVFLLYMPARGPR